MTSSTSGATGTRRAYRAARVKKGPGAALLLALTLGLAPGARAGEIEGVRFAPEVRARDVSLALHGVGLLRYRWVIKAYVAGLYLPPGVGADAVLGDVPKRLELHYFYGIDGEDFGPAADTILRGNLDAAALARLRPRIDAMNALYEDVEPGDRYALTYLPGVGTELTLNGRPKGTIPGADFAAAYFSIWLGESPLDADLRAQLVEGL